MAANFGIRFLIDSKPLSQLAVGSLTSEVKRVQTTHWSVIFEARDGNGAERSQSLALLCEIYWVPLYAYVRSRGYDTHEGEDLTQEFFAVFIEEHFLKNVAPEKGKFRNFLLASFNHFLANDWQKRNAKKRGGGISTVSIDVVEADISLGDSILAGHSPEDVYCNRCAMELLQRAYQALKTENGTVKRRKRFEIVENFISVDGRQVPYAELERSSGVSASALRVTVHRLRRRYGQLVRDEIRQTVSDDADVDAELQDLLSALSLK